MKYIKILLITVIGAIYIPLNMWMLQLQKWYLPLWTEDRVTYIAFAPVYWLYVLIVTVLSIPYEMLGQNVH